LTKKKKKQQQEKSEKIVRQVPAFSAQFKDDLAWWFKTDVKKATKILDMVTAVMANPFQGIGKPEPLKYLDSDTWSRRIDLEHRLIYRITKTQIDFLACRFHYE
jgi:toxin YoeB